MAKMSVYLGKIEDKDSFGYGLDAFVSFESEKFSSSDVKNTGYIAKVLERMPEEFCTLELGKGGSFLNFNTIKELKYSYSVKNGDIMAADVYSQSMLIATKDLKDIKIKFGKVLINHATKLVKLMFDYYNIISNKELLESIDGALENFHNNED